VTGSARESTRRVFFALWPEESDRLSLAHATRKAAAASGGRPVPEASLHTTLAFLGNVPERRLAELHGIAREVAAAFADAARPPPLCFERLAHWSKPQILVALAREEARAQALATRLKDLTAAAAFRPDLKPFHAHVTLARKVLQFRAPPALRPVTWRFDAFALIDSRTEPSGPVYSVIESHALVKNENVHA
jgi:RNA 2',3'-cyclic 3'-phosphodiesterase